MGLPFSESNEKFPKSLIKKLVIFTHDNANLTFFVRLETLDHFSKLKIILNTTAALFRKVIVCPCKTMSVNLWKNTILR